MLFVRVGDQRDLLLFFFFFFNDTATTEIYTLSLHDALPILNLVINLLQSEVQIFGYSRAGVIY